MNDALFSVLIGVGLSIVNILLAFVSAYIAFRKDTTTFLAIVLGSMIMRMFLMLIIIGILVAYANIHAFAFVLAFFISYGVLVLSEIVIIHRIYRRALERRQQKLLRLATNRLIVST